MEKEKENKKILKLLKGNTELIMLIASNILTCLVALYVAFRYLYSINAEDFYGVPKFYFYENLKADYIVNVVLFMVIMMIFFSPLIIKKFCKKNKIKTFTRLTYSFFIAVFVFYLSLVFCILFIIEPLNITGYDYVFLGICIFVSIVSWVAYFFAFKTDLKKDSVIDSQEANGNKHNSAKLKIKENINGNVLDVATALSIFIIVSLMFACMRFTPNAKKHYEIIQLEKSKCNVIVGYYRGSAIIMKGKIDYKNGDENVNLKIKKRCYKIESIEKKDLFYCDFNLVTCEEE